MVNHSTSEFRPGLKLLIDGDPCIILDSEFVKPGKGQAFTRIRIRNLKSGRVLDKTYKSGDSVPAADVVDAELQYLYNDGELWYFMDLNTYEQVEAGSAALGAAGQWLTGEELCAITLWDGAPLSVQAPNFVELTITETDPGVRGDTASGGAKPATLETGATVKVPLFVEQGEKIKVDTRTGEYVSRVKS